MPRNPAFSAARRLMPGLLALLAAGANPAYATHPPAHLDSAFFDALPTVLTASRLRQAQADVPGAITVIDRDMIRASGARNIADLLRWAPGFQVGQLTGYLPLTTYHGLADFAPRRMLIRIDGRSTYRPYNLGGGEWNAINVDIDDIERIEIFRGSNVAAFGSQAIMGVVDIHTRAAADSTALRIRIDQGRNHIRDRSVSVGQSIGPLSLRLSAGEQHDDGLHDLDDRYTRRHADLRADWQLAPAHRLELRAGGVDLQAGSGFGQHPPARDDLRDRGHFVQLGWHWHPSAGEEFSLNYFHQHDDTRGRYLASRMTGLDVPGGSTVGINYRHRVVRDELEFIHRTDLDPAWRLAWGANARRDTIEAPSLYARARLSYRNQRLFGNLEWRATPQLLLNAGLSIEAGNFGPTRLAPRLAANYRIGTHQVVRLAASRAYRNPTPFEREGRLRYVDPVDDTPRDYFRPSPGVRDERVDVREIGYLVEMPHYAVTLDARLFDEHVRRLTTTRSGANFLFPDDSANDGLFFASDEKARVRGFEVAAMWRPERQTWVGLNYARIGIDSRIPGVRRSAPRHSASAFVAWSPWTEWHVSLAHHYNGRMNWSLPEAFELDARHRTDLRLARHFAYGPTRGEFALIMARLGPQRADVLPGRTPSRELFARFRLEF